MDSFYLCASIAGFSFYYFTASYKETKYLKNTYRLQL